MDKVHLGRRAPRGRGSSEEESTTWTRFIWGGEHHVDEVHLGRRGREVDSLANLNYRRRICLTPPTCADDGVTPPSVVMVMSSSGCSCQHGLLCPHTNSVTCPHHTLHQWVGEDIVSEGGRE